MKVDVVIQARTGSERLPGKVLRLIDGRPVLGHVVDRAREMHGVRKVAIAIPRHDQELAEFAAHEGIPVVKGPEEDTLSRYRMACDALGSDAVVRLTADCPLLDPAIGSSTISIAEDCGDDYHYVAGYPRGVADIEFLSRKAIVAADEQATSVSDREHVVPWVVRATDRFRVTERTASGRHHRPELRVCIDEADDLAAVRMLFDACDERPMSIDDVIRTLDANPEIRARNAHVRQRSADPPRPQDSARRGE